MQEDLGDLFNDLKNPTQAARHWEAALGVFKKHLGPDHEFTQRVQKDLESLRQPVPCF